MAAEKSQHDPANAQFAELAAIGPMLPSGLEAAAEEVGSKRMARSMKRLAQRLKRGSQPEGASLSDIEKLVAALAGHNKQPDALSGELSDLVYGEQLTHQQRLSIVLALIYPICLYLLSLSIALVTSLVVMPATIEMMETYEFDMIGDVKRMMRFHQWSWAIVLLLSVGILAMGLLTSTLGPRRWWEFLSRNVPVIGPGLRWLDASDMCRHVSSLLAGGMPYPEALRLSQAGCRSPQFQRWLAAAAGAIESGSCIGKVSHLLPNNTLMLPILIDADTAGGRPERAWKTAASYYYNIGRARMAIGLTAIPLITYVVVFMIGFLIIHSVAAPLSILMELMQYWG